MVLPCKKKKSHNWMTSRSSVKKEFLMNVTVQIRIILTVLTINNILNFYR